MRWGSTFQVVEQVMMIMLVVMAMVIKCLGMETKKEKNKSSRQR